MDTEVCPSSSSSSISVSSDEISHLLKSLDAIDKKLAEVLDKCASILSMTEEIETDDEDELSKSPEKKKKKLTSTPGQIPFGYTRPAPYAFRSSLNRSRADFGPHPSFGPMRNPYYQ